MAYLAPARDEHGSPVFASTLPRPAGAFELHRERCRLLGVRDPEVVAALWAEEEAKRKNGEKPRRGRRR